MLIKRETFQKLKPHVKTYTDRIADQLYECQEYFKCDINEQGRFTSEDYYFCDLWRKHGGKVYINPYIELKHTGTYIFSGSLAKIGSEQL
jgi:hypothetical protein